MGQIQNGPAKSREYLVVWYGRVCINVYYVVKVYWLPTKSGPSEMLPKLWHGQAICHIITGKSQFQARSEKMQSRTEINWNQLEGTIPAPNWEIWQHGWETPNLTHEPSSQGSCARLEDPKSRSGSKEREGSLPTPLSPRERKCK